MVMVNLKELEDELVLCNKLRGHIVELHISWDWDKVQQVGGYMFELLIEDWVLKCNSVDHCIEVVRKLTDLKTTVDWI